ncbi:AAA family ATPase [Mucilaginibacter sp. SP1R1]|uniref:AAA family ATPase n=1 Tax=Mucilaginibacter sp. SP1R1 TaxID=2723091 RepID=UPI001618CB26|nr:AAA family ATPase [Mucilaginibacter sp. SP1R1]MBB6149450.1 KaiC/GvpD/RAD55 family RecA-like ATPase [Mucilaginibacter sp. SP1R1]
MKVVELVEQISKDAPVEKTLQDIIIESLIPQGIEIPKPEIVFGINGIPIFTKKSISVLIGRAKSGKTTVTSWIVSQSITAKVPVKVLWIDTEQGLYYGSRTQHWILSMSGLSSSEYLQFYDLKIFGPTKRIEMVEEIIKMFTPDLVVIDGIRDLVFDINNPEEATNRTGDLMRWAEVYDCHILNILHQNKGNEHARGHLGTEMINKSESVIKVEVGEDKLIVCSPEYTRSAPFEPFAFDRDANGMPQIVTGFSGVIATSGGGSAGRKKSVDPTEPSWNAAHIEIVNHAFKKKEFLKYSELSDNIHHYASIKGIKGVGQRKVREFITHYLDVGIVWEAPYAPSKTEKYQKNPKWLGFPYLPVTLTPTTGDDAPF